MELINVDLAEVRKIVNLKKEIAVVARDENFNRKVLEMKKISVLVFPGNYKSKDKLKQRDSGLNQVLCKIARDNDIKIGIDLNKVLQGNEFEIAHKISQLKQNIKLCNKFKVKMILVNCKLNNFDVKSFLLTLGASTNMAKFAVENCVKFD
jgi:RNase P/RNase MRP subunit p30